MTDSICILISLNITKRSILGSDCSTKYDKSFRRVERKCKDRAARGFEAANNEDWELHTSLNQTNGQTKIISITWSCTNGLTVKRRLAFLELLLEPEWPQQENQQQPWMLQVWCCQVISNDTPLLVCSDKIWCLSVFSGGSVSVFRVISMMVPHLAPGAQTW